MITQQNLQEVLEILGFKKLDSKQALYTKTYQNDTKMQVDFANQKLIYPQDLLAESDSATSLSPQMVKQGMKILSSLSVCIDY